MRDKPLYRKAGLFNNKVMNPLLAAYVQQHGKKYGGFVAKEFEMMPDPADHPVFLLIESR